MAHSEQPSPAAPDGSGGDCASVVAADVTLPCAVCAARLSPRDPDNAEQVNRPAGATVFVARGNPGSGEFVPQGREVLEVNICDGCLRWLAKHGRALLVGPGVTVLDETAETVSVERRPVVWRAGQRPGSR